MKPSAEVLGTFLLTLVAAGGDVIGAVSGGAVSLNARVVAPALLVRSDEKCINTPDHARH